MIDRANLYPTPPWPQREGLPCWICKGTGQARHTIAEAVPTTCRRCRGTGWRTKPKREDVPRFLVLAVCDFLRQACAEWIEGEPYPPDPATVLAQGCGVPEKVAYAAMERDVDANLLDYGVSIRRPWLTDSGRGVLNAGPPCCGGGPQWGHKTECPQCPD